VLVDAVLLLQVGAFPLGSLLRPVGSRGGSVAG